MTSRATYLAAARSELGYREDPPGSNRTKFAAEAHHPNGNAWCATFLVALARRTGLKLPYYGAYTPDFYNAFRALGPGHYGKTPKVGAFGFVYHPDMGRIAHTFVVEVVYDDGTFGTIEGNTNDAGGRTGGWVMRHRRSTYNISFGYPTYSTPTPAPTPVTTAEEPTMVIIKATGKATCLLADGRFVSLKSTESAAFVKAGVPVKTVSAAEWDALDGFSKRVY